MLYIVTIENKEYEVESGTRSKAINMAVHLYRDETHAQFSVPILMALAHSRLKEGGKGRYPRPSIS